MQFRHQSISPKKKQKTGYQGDFSNVQINKEIAKRLNDVITTQIKGLIEVSKTKK